MRGKRFIHLFGTCAVLVPGAAAAQSVTPGTAADAYPGEIVVTAQKREQKLIDVPVAVTAISDAELASRGAAAIEDLQYSVPGMSITQFSPGQQRIQLRGISVFGGLPTVGVYLDELPLNGETNQMGQDVRLLDMQRVEVLRGPGGTLYGQGAMGGTVRYITNAVELNSVEGSANGEVGFVNGGGTDWKLEGAANIPLVADTVGGRLAGSYQKFGGWIDNPVLGDTNANAGHALTLRGKLRFRWSEAFDVTLMAQHQELKLGAMNLAANDGEVGDRLSTPTRSRVTMLNALATYDFGETTLLSSTGYIRRKDRQVSDLSNSFLPFLEAPAPFGLGYPPGTFESVGLVNVIENEIFIQEVRLAGTSDLYGWTVGGFFRDSDTSMVSEDIVAPNILPPAFDLYSARGTYPDNSRSWAVFGEAYYKVTPELTATLGGRYFEDRRNQNLQSALFGSVSVDRGRESFHSFSPRFNLSWQPNDEVNFYANAAKGFRSGGFNRTSAGFGIVDVPRTYEPETLWSYEVGGKYQSRDRSFSAELAVYRNEWEEVQSLVFAPGSPVQFTVNGAKLAGWGVEGAVHYAPVPALSLSLTASWNGMEYRSTTDEHVRGDPADYVPEFTGSASAEYRLDVGWIPAVVRLDYQYSDAYQVFVRTAQMAPAKSEKQHLLNARVGFESERWNAAIFVRNILNRDSEIYPAFGSLYYPARMQPRVIGLSLGFHY